jgi:hypothetical protein
MADILKLWWSWRHKTDRPFLATIPPALLAIVCALGTIAASISSSYVIDSSNIEVLVNSPLCGRLASFNTAFDNQVRTGTYSARAYDVAKAYAKDCYPVNINGEDLLPATRKVFVAPNVALKVEKTTCPFASKMCIGTKEEPSQAIAIDSGLVDVNKAFGFNLADKDRVSFRKRTTCGVLPVDGYTSVVEASSYLGANDRETLPGESKSFLLSIPVVLEPRRIAD